MTGIHRENGVANDDLRWATRLHRLTGRWTAALARAAGVHHPERLESVRLILTEYASALRRAGSWDASRVAGALPAGELPSLTLLPSGATIGSGGASEPEASSIASVLLAAPSPALAAVRDVLGRPPAAPETESPSDLFARFCALTGISPAHIGGHGAHVAGIAFYWAVFARLTGGLAVSHEQETALLACLRRCREQLTAVASDRSAAATRGGEEEGGVALRWPG